MRQSVVTVGVARPRCVAATIESSRKFRFSEAFRAGSTEVLSRLDDGTDRLVDMRVKLVFTTVITGFPSAWSATTERGESTMEFGNENGVSCLVA